jgi:hypothetical protein
VLADEGLVRRYDIFMDREIGLNLLGPDGYLAEINRCTADRQTT